MKKTRFGKAPPKFNPGPDPLEEEKSRKTLEPRGDWKENKVLEYLETKMKELGISDQDMDRKKRVFQKLVWQMEVEKWPEEFDRKAKREYIIEFVNWMLGKSKYNLDLKTTPWGKSRLVGKGISEYIGELVGKKTNYELAVQKLRCFIPDDLDTAWLYFKFIVTKMPKLNTNSQLANNGSLDPDAYDWDYFPELDWWLKIQQGWSPVPRGQEPLPDQLPPRFEINSGIGFQEDQYVNRTGDAWTPSQDNFVKQGTVYLDNKTLEQFSPYEDAAPRGDRGPDMSASSPGTPHVFPPPTPTQKINIQQMEVDSSSSPSPSYSSSYAPSQPKKKAEPEPLPRPSSSSQKLQSEEEPSPVVSPVIVERKKRVTRQFAPREKVLQKELEEQKSHVKLMAESYERHLEMAQESHARETHALTQQLLQRSHDIETLQRSHRELSAPIHVINSAHNNKDIEVMQAALNRITEEKQVNEKMLSEELRKREKEKTRLLEQGRAMQQEGETKINVLLDESNRLKAALQQREAELEEMRSSRMETEGQERTISEISQQISVMTRRGVELENQILFEKEKNREIESAIVEREDLIRKLNFAQQQNEIAIKSLQEDIEKTKTELSQKSSHAALLQQKNSELSQNINQLEEELLVTKSRIKEIENDKQISATEKDRELRILGEKMKGLEQEKEDMNERLKRGEDQLRKYAEKLGKKKVKLQEERTKTTELMSTVQQAKERETLLLSRESSLNSQVQESSERLIQMQANIESMETEINHHRQQIAIFNAAQDWLSRESWRTESPPEALKNLSKIIEYTSEKEKEIGKMNEQLQSELSEKQKVSEELQGQLAARKKLENELTALNLQMTSLIASGQNKSEEYKEKFKEAQLLNETLGRSKEDYSALLLKTKAMEEELRGIRNQKSEIEAEKNKMITEFEKVKSEIESRLELAQGSAREAQKQVSELRADISKTKTELATTKKSISRKEQIVSELTKENQVLNEQIENLVKEQEEESEKETAKLKEEFETTESGYKTQLTTNENKIQELRSEIFSLQNMQSQKETEILTSETLRTQLESQLRASKSAESKVTREKEDLEKKHAKLLKTTGEITQREKLVLEEKQRLDLALQRKTTDLEKQEREMGQLKSKIKILESESMRKQKEMEEKNEELMEKNREHSKMLLETLQMLERSHYRAQGMIEPSPFGFSYTRSGMSPEKVMEMARNNEKLAIEAFHEGLKSRKQLDELTERIKLIENPENPKDVIQNNNLYLETILGTQQVIPSNEIGVEMAANTAAQKVVEYLAADDAQAVATQKTLLENVVTRSEESIEKLTSIQMKPFAVATGAVNPSTAEAASAVFEGVDLKPSELNEQIRIGEQQKETSQVIINSALRAEKMWNDGMKQVMKDMESVLEKQKEDNEETKTRMSLEFERAAKEVLKNQIIEKINGYVRSQFKKLKEQKVSPVDFTAPREVSGRKRARVNSQYTSPSFGFEKAEMSRQMVF